MRAKAKSSNTPYPLWVEGEYKGHYIDKGGYPGANIFTVNIDSLCLNTGAEDDLGQDIFENDILIYQADYGTSYLVVDDTKTAVDIITGKIFDIAQLKGAKIIGNAIDFPEFIEGLREYAENNKLLPYIPALNVQETPYPYFSFTCLKCSKTFFSCTYMIRHKECGGYLENGSFIKEGGGWKWVN